MHPSLCDFCATFRGAPGHPYAEKRVEGTAITIASSAYPQSFTGAHGQDMRAARPYAAPSAVSVSISVCTSSQRSSSVAISAPMWFKRRLLVQTEIETLTADGAA